MWKFSMSRNSTTSPLLAEEKKENYKTFSSDDFVSIHLLSEEVELLESEQVAAPDRLLALPLDMFKHLIPFIDVQTKTRLLVASRSVRDLVKPTFSPAFFNVQINLHDVKVAQQALSEIAAKEIRRQNRLTARAYRLLLLIGALLLALGGWGVAADALAYSEAVNNFREQCGSDKGIDCDQTPPLTPHCVSLCVEANEKLGGEIFFGGMSIAVGVMLCVGGALLLRNFYTTSASSVSVTQQQAVNDLSLVLLEREYPQQFQKIQPLLNQLENPSTFSKLESNLQNLAIHLERKLKNSVENEENKENENQRSQNNQP
ncbi:hypothetical protein AYM17_05455 [Coxiella burnetii]|nr:hypothetical protein CbuG_1123 [Coxiella burnetii CbuG_Q212]ATN66842.1 hypothetical protein AYM17_05455 [Coxiella burnetii]OYK86164.1 hypothetical protein CbuQ229_05680 [Coxiella burnetii]